MGRTKRKKRYFIMIVGLFLMSFSGYQLFFEASEIDFLEGHGLRQSDFFETEREVFDATINEKEFTEEEWQRFVQEANLEIDQIGYPMPLLLQNDVRWKNLSYGYGEEQNDLATNGCAILSLAMVLSFFQEESVSPEEILAWSNNHYYIEGQGTSWQIFEDFASAYGLGFHHLGSDYEQAKVFLSAGNPVIVSVVPGTFTEFGHIMVLAKNVDGQLIVYDPNDNPEKQHYLIHFDEELFQQEAIAYWTYSNQ